MRYRPQTFLSLMLLLLFSTVGVSTVSAQSIIKGTVTNEADQPLASVTVAVKGTASATSHPQPYKASLMSPIHEMI